MRITFEMFNADRRRQKREVVKSISVGTGHDVGEFEAVERLQKARANAEAADTSLAQAVYRKSCTDEALTAARRDVRRVSER